MSAVAVASTRYMGDDPTLIDSTVVSTNRLYRLTRVIPVTVSPRRRVDTC